jgi:chromosome segregation ATPase
MSIEQDAYNDLIKLSRMFKGLVDIGEKLKDVGSLATYAAGLQANIQALRDTEAVAKLQVNDWQSKADELAARHQAVADREALVTAAHEQAVKDGIAKGTAHAAALLAESNVQIAKDRKSADDYAKAALASAQAQAKEIENKTAESVEALATMRQQLDVHTKRLKGIKDEIEALKTRLG